MERRKGQCAVGVGKWLRDRNGNPFGRAGECVGKDWRNSPTEGKPQVQQKEKRNHYQKFASGRSRETNFTIKIEPPVFLQLVELLSLLKNNLAFLESFCYQKINRPRKLI